MIGVRRLKAVGIVLGAATLITCTHVWGEPGRDKSKDVVPSETTRSSAKADADFARDMAVSRFSDKTLVTYQSDKGAPVQFALLLRPKLDAAPRPMDVLALISDSAGMAQGPLQAAQKITESLSRNLGADDRLAVWTISTKATDKSNGFKTGDELKEVFKNMAQEEYPSGAVDLKKGLADAVASFQPDPSRQRLILFIGDGKSLANPLDDNDRAALCDQMVRTEIAFFAIPLGTDMDAANLHGLVSGTGGTVVRTLKTDKAENVVLRLKDAFAEPILYPTAFQLPAGATDVLPSRLPPLRGDASTLVLGKLPAGAVKFDYSVSGKVSGQDKKVDASEAMPEPDVDNFFLVNIAGQWQAAKDRPALLPADRALASAATQHELAREDLLAQAYWALEEDQIDPAFKLFQQAQRLDPHCVEAAAGIDIVAQIRDGKLTKEQLFQQVKEHEKKAGVKDRPARQGRLDRADNGVLVAMAEPRPDPRRIDAPQPLNPNAPPDILANERARQEVANQQATQVVHEAIRRANNKVLVQPAEAIAELKQTLDDVRNNPDLSERVRVELVDGLERTSQTIDRTGRRVQAEQELAQQAAAEAAAKAAAGAHDQLVHLQTRERMRQFADLMHLAREESAYLQAQSIAEDLTAQGQPVPVAVTAGYQVGLVGYNLRELRRLRTLRSEALAGHAAVGRGIGRAVPGRAANPLPRLGLHQDGDQAALRRLRLAVRQLGRFLEIPPGCQAVRHHDVRRAGGHRPGAGIPEEAERPHRLRIARADHAGQGAGRAADAAGHPVDGQRGRVRRRPAGQGPRAEDRGR